jgi:UDP-perosamine 4-acetyltransferase
LKRLDAKIVGILDSSTALRGSKISGISVIGGDEDITGFDPAGVLLANGIGSVSCPLSRKRVFLSFKNRGYSFCSIVHPDANVAPDAVCGEGTQVFAGAVIQTCACLGSNCLINMGALIAHDCTVGSHVHVAPGAGLGGEVKVGDTCHVGSGAIILQSLTVGPGAVVGAGAVVLKDVPEGATVVGVPARVLSA